MKKIIYYNVLIYFSLEKYFEKRFMKYEGFGYLLMILSILVFSFLFPLTSFLKEHIIDFNISNGPVFLFTFLISNMISYGTYYLIKWKFKDYINEKVKYINNLDWKLSSERKLGRKLLLQLIAFTLIIFFLMISITIIFISENIVYE